MQEITLHYGSRQLAALGLGDPGKPLLLALHGWLDNAASFIPLAQHLQNYYVLAIDLPGHGMSPHRSEDAHYHLVDWVQDLHGLITAQGWQDVSILGHSLGGIIASLYAASFPEMVKHLILIESFGPLTEPEDTSPQQLRDSVLSRLEIASRPARHPKDEAQAVTARKLAGDMRAPSAALLVKRNLRALDDGCLQWRSDRRLRTISSLRMTNAQAEAFLRAVQAPVLLLLGEKGFEKLRVNLAKRQEWVKDLTVRTLPGGHHLHMDYPLQAADSIQDFLK